MTGSFWLEEAAEPFPRRAAAGRPDVVVIGGGVTGCSCALTLAERGVRVRVVEAREVAGGASGRNGGFALRGASRPYDRSRSELGAERAQQLWRFTERTLDRLEELAGDAFRRVGSLRLAADDAELDGLRSEYGLLRADGFAAEWVAEPAPPLDRLYRGAVLHPTDGATHPARWVRRLARRAAEAGAEIVEHVRAEPGDVSADAVVLATDGFTAAALPELRDVVRPTRGQILVTEPLGAVLFGQPHYARRGYDYWHQLSDGRLVIGGRRDVGLELEDTDVEETTPAVQRAIEDLGAELVGRALPVSHRWAGIWGTTADGLPLVGRLPERARLWIAGGYSGHGNVLGLACGDLVARAVLGESPVELELFDPARALG